MNRTIRGVDYSFDRANLAELKRLGFEFVMRYLRGLGKALDAAEVKAIARAGLALGVFDETTAARSRAGRAAGEQDARAANAAAVNVGVKGIPIFMVDDANSTFAQVRPYFESASAVLGKGRRGAYGSGKLLRELRAAGLIDFAVEAGARSWGDGTRDPNAEVLQDPSSRVAGAAVDVLHAAPEAFAAFRGGTIKPPKPRKYGSRDLKFGDTGADVREFQRVLSMRGAPFIQQDGVYGKQTEDTKRAAMKKYGWPDSLIAKRAKTRSIGKPGLKALKNLKTRPQSYKDREKQRRKK